MIQQYGSACTSINSTKLPTLFNKVELKGGTRNLDYGGGKYDNVSHYLGNKGISNYIYDPYNRSLEHNVNTLMRAPFDSATLSNVLNVVFEEEVRIDILKRIKGLLKPNSKLYITVYEGNRSGEPKVNHQKNSCQLNRKLKDYVEEVNKVFKNIELKRGVIIAWD